MVVLKAFQFSGCILPVVGLGFQCSLSYGGTSWLYLVCYYCSSWDLFRLGSWFFFAFQNVFSIQMCLRMPHQANVIMNAVGLQ